MKSQMPIRAAPFAHQKDAYEFALKQFGILEDDDDDSRKICTRKSNGFAIVSRTRKDSMCKKGGDAHEDFQK